MMMEEDVEKYLKSTAESYNRGKKSIETAAKEAGISVWELIDHTQEQKIATPAEELEREYAESKNI